MIESIIIDDTRMARKELRFLLSSHKNIKVIAEAENAEEAEVLIREMDPDLIFLDIQMPDKNGFELLSELDRVPQVIFTTAYDQYAMKAFEYNALDYLEKPITESRLKEAISRVQVKINERDQLSAGSKRVLSENNQVFVKDGENCWFVTLKEIRLFEIMDNYTRIFFEDQKPMIPRTLNYMESRLDPECFFRANRQQIINLKWIEKIDPWFSGTIKVTLKDGTEVEISRRQTTKFKELMSSCFQRCNTLAIFLYNPI